jgi:hypothetical protein
MQRFKYQGLKPERMSEDTRKALRAFGRYGVLIMGVDEREAVLVLRPVGKGLGVPVRLSFWSIFELYLAGLVRKAPEFGQGAFALTPQGEEALRSLKKAKKALQAA